MSDKLLQQQTEQIEYLQGQIAGLEEALEELLLVIGSGTMIDDKPHRSKSSGEKLKSKKKTIKFNIDQALTLIQHSGPISRSTVEIELSECWGNSFYNPQTTRTVD